MSGIQGQGQRARGRDEPRPRTIQTPVRPDQSVVFRLQHPPVDVTVRHPDGPLPHPGSNHRHHCLTSPGETTADLPSSTSVECLMNAVCKVCFVKSKSNKSGFLFFFFFACKLYECVWFDQKFDEFIMFIFSILYYLDTEFFVIVYRRMSVNMLVFTWISSFSSLKCPDIIHGLMQFVSNEICIETFGYLVSRVWIVCSQDVQCDMLSVLYV